MSRRKRINWKKQLRMESFYLKFGRMPTVEKSESFKPKKR